MHSRRFCTVGPFFAPNARPAPQPAMALVQIDFVPSTRSITHSRAVYTASPEKREERPTTEDCHRSRHALSLEVRIAHRLLELHVTAQSTKETSDPTDAFPR